MKLMRARLPINCLRLFLLPLPLQKLIDCAVAEKLEGVRGPALPTCLLARFESGLYDVRPEVSSGCEFDCLQFWGWFLRLRWRGPLRLLRRLRRALMRAAW